MWVNACEISIIYAFSCMGLHQFYYTGGGICVKIYNNNFKGGGAFEIRKKNHQRFRNVAECLVQAKLTPHCKNGNVDIYMEHIFFWMWTFFWNKYLFKNIYVYTCIFTVFTLGPTLKHLWERILSHTVNLPTKFRVVAFRFKIFIIW